MSERRFEKRHELYKALINESPMGEYGSDYQKESLKASMEQAYRLLKSPEASTFNIKDEPEESYKIYNTGKDRKSTRLNSSHVAISYAVFTLKKKIYARNSTASDKPVTPSIASAIATTREAEEILTTGMS